MSCNVPSQKMILSWTSVVFACPACIPPLTISRGCILGEVQLLWTPQCTWFWEDPHPYPHLMGGPVTQTQPDVRDQSESFLLATEIGSNWVWIVARPKGYSSKHHAGMTGIKKLFSWKWNLEEVNLELPGAACDKPNTVQARQRPNLVPSFEQYLDQAILKRRTFPLFSKKCIFPPFTLFWIKFMGSCLLELM